MIVQSLKNNPKTPNLSTNLTYTSALNGIKATVFFKKWNIEFLGKPEEVTSKISVNYYHVQSMNS